jgi:hypothetical protein
MRYFILLFLIAIAITSTAQTKMPSNDIKVYYKGSNNMATQTTIPSSKSVVELPGSVPQDQYYDLDVKQVKSQEDCTTSAFPTSNKAKFQQQEYTVYSTVKGKLFIVIQNKDNEGFHRKYIH